MRFRFPPPPTILLVVLTVLTTPTFADAGFYLRLQSGSDVVVVQDNQVGDANSAVGAITFIGNVGSNFTTNVTTGLTNPIVGNNSTGHLDLNSVNVASNGSGSLTITLVNDAMSSPTTTPAEVQLISQLGGTLSGSGQLTYQSWFNPSGGTGPTFDGNGVMTVPGGSQSSGQLGPYSGPFSGYSATNYFTLSSTPYTLFNQAVISFNGPGSVSFNGDTLLATPAPGGLALALCALPFLGFAYSRRRRANKA